MLREACIWWITERRATREAEASDAAKFNVMESFLQRARCIRTLLLLQRHAQARRQRRARKANQPPRRRKRFHPGAW